MLIGMAVKWWFVLFIGLLSFATVSGLLPNISDLAIAAETSAPAVHGEAAALIDVKSGRILYSKNGDKLMRIASLTKVMTAIVAIEQGNLSETVKVSKNAAGKEGSSIYLKNGEQMSLGNMLYGLMLRSGNDAATAIAEHIGGSVGGFAFLMNREAEILGMRNSVFYNPSGLDEDKSNMSTANDMAKLTAFALRNPAFQEIVKTRVKTAPNPTEDWDYKWVNKNKMLTIYEGADGVKTGFTKIARRCLISSATKGNQQLAVVTLNDPDDWLDHTRLLDYGFSHYPQAALIGKGDAVQGTPWVAGKTVYFAGTEQERVQVSYEILPVDTSSTDFRLGFRGTLHFRLKGALIGSTPVYEPGSLKLIEQDHAPSAFMTESADKAEGGLLQEWLRKWLLTVHALLGGNRHG